MRQHMIAFPCPAGCLVPLKEGHGSGEIGLRNPKPFRSLVKQIGGTAVDARVGHQGQVMSEVGALPGKSGPFRSDGDAVGQKNRVTALAGSDGVCGLFQAALHFKNCPEKGGRIPSIEYHRVEPV